MDTYEKAYKAVLQTAKQWIKDGCTDKEKICLECVFPELRESEDERIRKAIIKLMTVASEAYLIESTGFKKEQFFSYLEKQKELFESGKGLYYYDGEKTTFCGYPATEENPYDFAMSQQKEHKPAWSEEDERIRKLLIWQVHRNIEDETNDLAQSVYDSIKGHDPDLEESIEDWKKCLAWLKSLRPCRPSWKPSEGQLNAMNFAITYFMHETNYKNPTELRELYDDLLKLK